MLAVAMFAATTRRARIILGSALFLTACGDFVTGLVYHRYLCATQAEAVIYAHAERVEGYFALFFSVPKEDGSSPRSALVLEYLDTSPYRWVEGSDCVPGKPTCRYFRYYRSSDGKLAREPISTPTRFAIIEEERDLLGGLVHAREVRIEDLRARRVLARERHFIHEGGWIFHGYDDSSRGCGPRSSVASYERIQEVLRPLGRTNG